MRQLILFIVFSVLTMVSDGQPPIQDNSFMIEEAYNQEKGVVQHILTNQFNHQFTHADGSFTQEWPVGSAAHQLSFTLPFSYENKFALQDLLINYRYQLVSEDKLFIAPRFSFIFPTGNTRLSDQTGMTGFQINVPLSFEINPKFTLHANIGNTFTWSTLRKSDFRSQQSEALLYGMSFIYLMTGTINVMLETIHTSSFNEYPLEGIEPERTTIVNPGVRFAINFPSGLQIVPGFSIPYNVGSKERFYFLYLSVEHPFKRSNP